MRTILLATSVIGLAACNPVAQVESADAEIATFHERFDAGDFAAIWSDASSEFQQATPRAEFDSFMTRMRASVGSFDEGSRTGFNLDTNNGVTTTTISMSTTYENGSATEEFMFIGPADDLELFNWNIQSTAPWADAQAPAQTEKPEVDGAAAAPAEKPQ